MLHWLKKIVSHEKYFDVVQNYFLQKSPYWMVDLVLNTPLDLAFLSVELLYSESWEISGFNGAHYETFSQMFYLILCV